MSTSRAALGVDTHTHAMVSHVRAVLGRQIKEELFRYRRLIADTLTQSFRDTAVGLVIVGQRGAEPAPVASLGGQGSHEDGGGGGWSDADAVRFAEQLDLHIRPQIAGLLRVRPPRHCTAACAGSSGSRVGLVCAQVNGLREAVSQYRVKLKAEVKNTVRSVSAVLPVVLCSSADTRPDTLAVPTSGGVLRL